ncbi:MAG: alkaline phosphatase D family protein [Bacteroidota bacterium]
MNRFFKKHSLSLVLIALSISGSAQKSVSKIAFGSCGNQNNDLPVFDVVVKHQPDLFIFLGDNIYGDTGNMKILKAKYHKLGTKPSFKNLKQHVDIIATWDDHDYGWNDLGRLHPGKVQSKEVFLDFFDEPQNSDRRKHNGIYTSYMYETNGKKLQVILLDTRTFRDGLRKYAGELDTDKRFTYQPSYSPHPTADSTFLGEEQWKWLKEELMKPADLRLIGSGSQFGIEFNGYEGWANFPYEQKRFLNLIKETKANGVLFLSGDVHYAEISKLTEPDLYPVYDFTSSGLSSTWHFATPNNNRIEGPIMENHFGLLTIDWNENDPKLKMEVWDVLDKQRITRVINLSEITFKQ